MFRGQLHNAGADSLCEAYPLAERGDAYAWSDDFVSQVASSGPAPLRSGPKERAGSSRSATTCL